MHKEIHHNSKSTSPAITERGCICTYNMVKPEWWYSLYPMKPKLHSTSYPCTGTSYYKYTKGGLDFPLCTFHANTRRERKATLTVKREACTLYSRWCVQFRVECLIIEHTIHMQTHTQIHKESDITDRRGKHNIWPNSYQWMLHARKTNSYTVSYNWPST